MQGDDLTLENAFFQQLSKEAGMALKINFTKSTLDELTCPEGKADILVYDTEVRGLAVRVTKAGGKTFFVVRKIKDKDHRIKIDTYDKRTAKIPAIREKAQEVYTNLESRLDHFATPSPSL